MLLRKIIWGLLGLAAAVGLFELGYVLNPQALRFYRSRTVVQVNGVPITEAEVAREMNFLQARENSSSAEITREDLLERMINDELIFQEAKRRKYSVPPAQIQQRQQEFWSGYSSRDMKRLLRESHLSPSAWTDLSARQQLIETAIQNVIESGISVAPEEVEEYYWTHLPEFNQPNQVRARQIVVETEEQAKGLKEKLEGGADFRALASQYSLGPEKDRGGDLGWVGRNDLPAMFSKILFRLPLGKVSEPVNSPYGYHLFVVESAREEGKVPLEEARPKITADLKLAKVDHAFQTWLEELRAKARIEWKDNLHEVK